MKHTTLITLLASAALAAGGCTKQEAPSTADGVGTLRIDTRPDITMTTRAQIEITPAPSAEEFALTITGTDYNRSWESIPAFNEADESLKAGNYTARIVCGDAKAEGVDKPCYEGELDFTIVARQESRETIPARIVNSQVAVTSTEAFRQYFHEATFTVTTSAGNRFTFTPGSGDGKAVFVEAGTRLTLTGTAKLQSQTGTAFDRTYTFPEQTLEQTVARTRHTSCFDARDNGSATVTINLDDEYINQRTFTVELNGDAQ